MGEFISKNDLTAISNKAMEARLRQEQKEQVRSMVEVQVGEAIRQHKIGCEQLKRSAREALVDCILPWWIDFQISRVCEDIKIIVGDGQEIELETSDPILYFNPLKAIEIITRAESMGEKPFVHEADRLIGLQKSGGDGVKTGIVKLTQRLINEEWIATFVITRPKGGEELQLVIRRDLNCRDRSETMNPTTHDKDILVDPTNPELILSTINPVVFIEFADQLRNGVAGGKLRESVEDLV